MFALRFDMRSPAMAELSAAALDMCGWHHGSPDGYLPTPLILGSAIAARSERLALNLIVLLPLYDPVRLAEEMVVLDIISRGRASNILGLGYRPEEYITRAETAYPRRVEKVVMPETVQAHSLGGAFQGLLPTTEPAP